MTLGGAATNIGDVAENLKGLAFVGAVLYGAAAFDHVLYTLDPTDGSTLGSVAVSLVGGGSVIGFNGLATNPDTGVLWGIARTSSGTPGIRHLVTIDPSTGLATSVGALGDGFAGLAFASDVTVPEPGTLALLGIGIAGLAARRRQRRT